MKLNLFKFSEEEWEKIKKELKSSDSLDTYIELTKYDIMSEDFFKLLKKLKLSKKDYLGKGKFNIVFEKDGMVYKLTKNKADIDKALMFNQLKESLPEEYKKFVMDVYEASYDNESKFYILVCEELYPLSLASKQLLLKEEAVAEKDYVFPTFLTLNVYKKILEDLLSNEENPNLKSAIKSIIDVPSLNKRCYDFLIEILKKLTDIKKMAQAIVRGIYKFISSNLTNEGVTPQVYDRALAAVSIHAASFQRLPKYEEDYLETELDKEFHGGDLLEFLKYLRDEKGIRWEDVHTSNIMHRANGELVLSDTGFFRVN